MKFKISLLFIAISMPALGFEINTHQAITHCAITNNCDQLGAKNLNSFVINANLDKEDYSNENFVGYGRTYLGHAIEGRGLNKKGIDFRGNSGESYIDMIEAGSILEDSLYSDYSLPGDGRYNNHFYSAQFAFPLSLSTDPRVHWLNLQRLSNRALLADSPNDAMGERTDSISWALKKDVRAGPVSRTNYYNIFNAFNYYRDSFEGTEDERRKNQAKLFVSLGHMIHLNQDLHSPAHVRNGPHAGGDYHEIFNRYDGGFLLRGGNLSPNNDPDIFQAIKDIDINDIMLTKNKYSSYQDFYTKEAEWISENFFSEAHGLDFTEDRLPWTKIDPITGEGIQLDDDDCGKKNTTIFDTFRNPHLDQSETTLIPRTVKWNYVRTNGNASSVIGDISNKTVVAFEENSFFWTKCRTMTAVVDGGDSKSYANYDKKALKDTAKNILPRAVASTQAFINYFFRGRINAEVNLDVLNSTKTVKNITIKNIADDRLISDADLATLIADTGNKQSLKVLYLKKGDATKNMKELLSAPLTHDVSIDGTYKVEGIQAAIDADVNLALQDIDKFVVLFDGEIGRLPNGALDDYNIGARGLTVTYATVNPTGKLNDTGLTLCGESALNNLDCPVANFPGQDAQFGRDVTHNDNSDGHAGFSFTKISNTGVELPANAAQWSCVKDNVTGLVWEVKNNAVKDEHSIYNSYSWYDPNPETNGGNAGEHRSSSNICDGWSPLANPDTHCNTYNFTKRVNQKTLCGARDWRLPTVDELLSIMDFSQKTKSLDMSYFRSDSSLSSGQVYWTSTTSSTDANLAGYVYEDGGWINYLFKTGRKDHAKVRLVRGEL